MTSMPDKEIANISYNHLSLPRSMSLPSNQSLSYQYTADGNKVMKALSHTEGNTINTITTDYIDGFHYIRKTGFTVEPMMRTPVAMQERAFLPVEEPEPEPQNLTLTATPQLEFFPTAEGFYDFANSKYIYQYKDHLGNARVSFAKKSDGTGIDLADSNDYYPFGMNHYKGEQSAMFGLGGNYVNYKYNGKELQETGMYDYGARFYMPDIGKFGTHDPLSEKTMEPYAYVYNNPIKFIDPTGMEGESSTDTSSKVAVGYDKEVDYNKLTSAVTFSNNVSWKEGKEKTSEESNLHNTGKSILGNYSLDEEPVNFFGNDAKGSFKKKYEDSKEMFKNSEGDGKFRVYGHGWTGYMWDGDTKLSNAKDFDKAMSAKNSRWNEVDKMKNPVLILYVCYSGSDTNENESMGKKISRAHPNLTVIGFRNDVVYNTPGTRITKVKKGHREGDIIFFRNGKALKGYVYSDYLKKYKNFQ